HYPYWVQRGIASDDAATAPPGRHWCGDLLVGHPVCERSARYGPVAEGDVCALALLTAGICDCNWGRCPAPATGTGGDCGHSSGCRWGCAGAGGLRANTGGIVRL